MKKLILLFVVLFFAYSVFAAGSEEDSDMDSAAGGVREITIWTAWLDPGEEAVYKKFNETHPDVQLSWELLAFKDYATKIIAAARTGQLPDILRLQPKAPAQYGNMGYLAPLNDIIEAMDGRESYPESYLKYNTVDGNLYGVPFFSLPHLLFYRTDLFEANNLAPPRTWEEFKTAAETLSDGDLVGYYGFLNDASVGHMVHQWMGANGADTFGPGLELAIDSPKVQDTLNFLYDLYESGAMNSDVASATMTDARLVFVNGEAGMITTSSSFIPTVAKSDLADSVGILPIPKNGTDQNYFAYHSYSVTKDADNLDDITELFVWMNDPENQKLYWSEGTRLGDIPANSRFFDEGIYFSIDKVKEIEPMLAPAVDATANGWFPGMEYEISEFPGLFDTQNIYQNMALQMIVNGSSASEATEWAKKQMEEVMNR